MTTLAVNALGDGASGNAEFSDVRRWLLSQQYRTVHPYTQAAPGGWAWTFTGPFGRSPTVTSADASP